MNKQDKLRIYQRSLSKYLNDSYHLTLIILKIIKLKLSPFDLKGSCIISDLKAKSNINKLMKEVVDKVIRTWAWESLHSFNTHIPDERYSSEDSLDFDSENDVSSED